MRVLVPDLPDADDLAPWLRRIDDTRWYTNFGPLEREFGQACARYLSPGDPPAVTTCSSGAAALELALAAADLPRGGRALVPALTFPATAAAIVRAGLRPVLADVDPRSWLLTPECAREAAGRIDVVVPVAAFGCPLPADAWDAFVQDTGVPVVMDAANAFLRQPMPRRCTAVFSFHATKTFGIGEGGLVAAYDADRVERVRRLSNFDFDEGYVGSAAGNAKMSEYHAAVGLAQFARIDILRARYRAVFDAYDARLPASARQAGEPGVLMIATGLAAPEVEALLGAGGVETRRWYQPDLTRQPAFADSERVGRLEVTEALGRCATGVPFHNFLTLRDVERVCRLLEPALAGLAGARPGAGRELGRAGGARA